MTLLVILIYFFFFNDTATTEIYTLSLHDALPISGGPVILKPNRGGKGLGVRLFADAEALEAHLRALPEDERPVDGLWLLDRKSTRLNSSHANISYAVFCLKKKKKLIRALCEYDQL